MHCLFMAQLIGCGPGSEEDAINLWFGSCYLLQNDTVLLPVAVRDHTAHVVGNKMVVFFGYAPATNDVIINFVQEYDFG